MYIQNIEKLETNRITKLIVVRHAESVANTQGIYQGQTYDTGLSSLGKKQAKQLAKYLSGFPVSQVISSPLRRTYETAVEVTKMHGCELEFEKKLMETNHGVWEGKEKIWVDKNYKELYRLWQTNPDQVVFPGGEAFTDTVERVLSFLQGRSFKKNSVIVTHDNIVRIMIALIRNMNINDVWSIPLETASVNIFEVNKVNNKNMFRVLGLNRTSHLGELRNDIALHAL